MKKKARTKLHIAAVLLLLLGAGAIVWLIMNYKAPQEEEEYVQINGYDGDGTPVVMENDRLVFTMDPRTTQFQVEVKDTGKIWYSNPAGASTDPVALTEEKGKLLSTLVMSYSMTAGLEVTMDSDSYSIKNGIYQIEEGEDFVKVRYSLGNVQKEFMIPPVTVEENFRKWCDAMDAKSRDLVQQYYKKYDINKLGKKDNEKELLEKYPILAEQVIYVIRDTTKDNVRSKMEEAFEAAGYTAEDYMADKELDKSETSSDKPIFDVNMIYRLDGDDLIVEIPLQELVYKDEYPMYTITPLPYFGAGGTEDEGYLLVPEGGGAAIHFNNGKVAQSSYYTNVYGWDMCLSRDAVVHNTRAYYGLFGIASGEDSFLCMLEEGSPYASIQADISGKNNSYNYVNAVYSVCQREKYDVGDIANSDIYQYVDSLPDETLTQRYHFVDSSDYVDMAKEYGDYLQKRYEGAMDLNADESTPVAVEIVGAVDKVRQILGVPVSRPLKLTSFAEAADMISDLVGEGIGNLAVKLTGWCNGGVKQKMLSRIKPIGSLGGSSALGKLAAKAEELKVPLYLDGITQYAFDSNLLDGFFSYTDAAKFISKERAKLHIYSPVTYSEREGTDPYYLLRSPLALKMADNLVRKARSLSAGVSFQDTGKDLSADYDRKKGVSREKAKDLQEEQLRTIHESGLPVMINMGNDYAVPYSTMVTNMDLKGSEYTILDECMPFFQMAVHGLVNYTGYPLNICGNTQEELLVSAEYGAGLSFTLMRESSFALQKTLYTEYYGSSYDAWKQDMLDIYRRYDEELGHTFCQRMTGHRNLTPVVSCTEYEDGTRVYVNYGYKDAQAEDVTVPARDYLVVR